MVYLNIFQCLKMVKPLNPPPLVKRVRCSIFSLFYDVQGVAGPTLIQQRGNMITTHTVLSTLVLLITTIVVFILFCYSTKSLLWGMKYVSKHHDLQISVLKGTPWDETLNLSNFENLIFMKLYSLLILTENTKKSILKHRKRVK